MAAVTPVDLIEGYVLLAAAAAAPSQGIFIPLTSVPDLSATEAAATTGDGRKVVFALTKEFLDRYTLLATNARPGKLVIEKGPLTIVNPTTVQQPYTLRFSLDTTNADLSAE